MEKLALVTTVYVPLFVICLAATVLGRLNITRRGDHYGGPPLAWVAYIGGAAAAGLLIGMAVAYSAT